MADETADDAGTGVVEAAHAGEPDRYLAALLAPAPQRDALLALAALATELALIPHRAVREPFMGEIRLQWWRTALGLAEGESGAQGVADAVRLAVRRYDLPMAQLDAMIDARALELLAAPFDDDAALYEFLWKTEGALFALNCRILGLGASPDVEAACLAAGRAYGLARLLMRLPRILALGRVPLPQSRIASVGLAGHELLAGTGGARVQALLRSYYAQIRGNLLDAGRFARRLPRRERVAFLPLALVEPYVRVLERQGGGALRAEIHIVPLIRVWRVAAAHLLGRL
ncbi:MAG TPA: squalene/phytoene synthase family protein [Hyphomicrobiaceae bacterium]|nr:squalene/phytoene synthase family protein [Hyphomicrobiaceae bacterium]